MPTGVLYDIHGNLPALEAALDDARAAGASRWLLGGDLVAFGAWPRECLAALDALEDAVWIRGNTERWLADRSDLPDPTMVEATAELLEDHEVQRLVALPGTHRTGDTLFCHASPTSDMASFAPEPAEGDADLLRGVDDARRLVFGHTHVQFSRTEPESGIELVNPGSVGMPCDGDHRAAYALVADDGTLELRRVAYDHQAAIAALEERFAPAPWRDTVRRRLAEARF
ncbi:metallophosphoesterase [Conexibacter sp. SYSU D00693]|uniref:metallophosphoesterase family protein n=1 Tax=Conexibacter sp. SYSU D00693 TaxID=2812560 RepID=UPI00196AA384|nr:metallophosphoesterase family protein [Conexibacter sp. SYSU D00693]